MSNILSHLFSPRPSHLHHTDTDRVGDTEKVFGDLGGRYSAEEWEVGDCLEAVVSGDE